MANDRKPYSLNFNHDWQTRLKRRLIQALAPRHFTPPPETQPPRPDARAFALWLGRRGEAYALWWLKRHKGMIILGRNVRYGHHELDLIAKDGQVVVFVEVRTLSSDHLQLPSASITETKKTNLHQAAAAWRKANRHKGPWRMDIIGIVWPDPEKPPARVDHWEKSF